MDNQSKLIKQLNELYFIQRGHYLVQYKEPIGYIQYTKGQINSKGKKVQALMDWQLEKHLLGEFTVGTFAKFFSKFMTFDVDFHDLEMAKWITYKVTDTLENLGIENYYISFSGSKGYHVDIFFDDLIQVDQAENFFKYVVNYSDITQYFDEGNKVEFRITNKQGVKIPLGVHQKTGNYCGFCEVKNGLTVMSKQLSEEYLFSIVKIKRKIILDILSIDDTENHTKTDYIKTEEAISPHRPLANYEQSEEYSIDRAINLLQNGLTVQGSRHKSILLIGLYLKYSGLELEQCKTEIHNWMDWQDSSTYSTKLVDCHKDIDQTVSDIYERNYNMTTNKKDISVSLDEIKWIIDKCPEKNQKLITYAMLIHSKRHATMLGVFFMPFKDIETATGLDDNTVERQVNKLIKLGVIEVVERNRKPKGQGLMKKLPNLYRIVVQSEIKAENIIQESLEFVTEHTNNIEVCMKFYYSDKELKQMLPRRQYKSLVG